MAYNVQVFAKGGNYSATDELCRNVDRCTNAHFNYRQPAFCKYYVIGSGGCLAQKLIRITKEKRKNAKRVEKEKYYQIIKTRVNEQLRNIN